MVTSSVAAADEFANLEGVMATPMASSELDVVKGTHFHFFTPSNNELGGMTGQHVVNIQIGIGGIPTPNADPSPAGPSPITGKGYRGLCVAGGVSQGISAVGPC